MKQYFSDIFAAIYTILVGMSVTMNRLLKPSVTIQYPHERMIIPPGSRNQLVNIIDDCIGCDQCVRACPVDCIIMETIKGFDGEDLGVTTDGSAKRLHVTQFDIDMAKCCFCGLCTVPCPTECLVMTDKYEYATQNRDDLIFKFASYSDEEVAELRKRETVRKAEKEAKKLAAAKAKAEAAAKKEEVKKPDSE